MAPSANPIVLPRPKRDGDVSLEETLRRRRSVRDFASETLTLRQVSQILWAAQGETGPEGERTAPSAGASYPLETHLALGEVHGLERGVYRYRARGHELVLAAEGDRMKEIAAAAVEQHWIADASVIVLFSAVYGRTTRTYGERGRMYVHMEAGHAVQSVALQVVAMDLGSVVVGAIDDERIRRILRMPKQEVPLCLMPVGRPKHARESHVVE